jgi:anthranilate synthase component 1
MLTPSVEEIKKYASKYKTIPVFYRFPADQQTPINIYSALSENKKYSFILESVNNGTQWDRYSFVGFNPIMEVKIKGYEADIIDENGLRTVKTENPVEFLKELLENYSSPKIEDAPSFNGGFIGYFGYDTIRYIEKKLTNINEDDIKMPDCDLFLYKTIVAYDHLTSDVVVIENLDADKDIDSQYSQALQNAKKIEDIILDYCPKRNKPEYKGNVEVTSNVTKEEYMSMVEKAKEYIVEGDIFQVVLSQRFAVKNPPDSFSVYRRLRATNPSPYLYYFKTPEYEIAGSSPEMLAKVKDGIISNRPIAGTMPRGKTYEQDLELERKLVSDEKERAEHNMLVDLGRNDVGKVSEFGSVEVTRYMVTERYSKVMHLVSDVKGKLREDKKALDALVSILPAGTLSGAPKVRAMEIIDELENKKRGLYGGTVGYLDFNGNIDTCIAIRTVLFRNNCAYVQAGAGIVADSVPEKEYMETKNKALAMVNAIKEAASL